MELSAKEIGDFKSRLERVEKELKLKKATVSDISNFIDLFELLWLSFTLNKFLYNLCWKFYLNMFYQSCVNGEISILIGELIALSI